jgi:hypothetical protein
LDRAGVGHAAWRLAMRHHLGQRRLLPCLGDDMVAVDRVDGAVGIPWQTMVGTARPSPLGDRPPPPMAAKAAACPGRAASQPRMDAGAKYQDRWPP